MTLWNPLSPSEKIGELENIGHAVVKLYSMSQLVNYRLKITKNTNDFKNGIRTWIMRLVSEHMWTNLKTHFREGHPS